MNQTDNKIQLFISTSILTFVGLLNLLMVLFLQYDRFVTIEMAPGVIWAVVISVVMAAFFVYIKKQWITWLGIIALGGVVFWIAREAVMGGTAEFINAVINEMAGFFETEMYFIEMPLRLMKEAEPDMAVYMALCLIGALYAFCFTHRRMAIVPMIISLSFTVLAAIMDIAGVAAIVIGIAYGISLLIMILASWGRTKDRMSYFWVQAACIVSGIAIVAVTMIISAVNPKTGYEKPQYFNDVYSRGEEMYGQFQNGELTINKIIDFVGGLLPWEGNIPGPGAGIASGNNSEIGAGELGHVDKLEFSGQEVLKVSMPDTHGKVYIRGYIGADYKGDRWAEPDWNEENKASLTSMRNLSYQTISLLAKHGEVNAYETGMNIEYIAGDTKYVFIPSHAALGISLSMTAAEGYGIAEYPFYTEFIHINENEYSKLGMISDSQIVLDDDDYDLIMDAENSYRNMVYDRYLDVNTTAVMREKFKNDWSGYSIDDASDRYVLACAIRKYLADNCTYTVSPGALPEGEDFVEYFVQKTHQGYCTYFATAAVMMLRSAGVPARYVEGYTFDTNSGIQITGNTMYTEYRNSEENISKSERRPYVQISVADSAAHAWVQYYVDGIGWVDLDVTPGNYAQPATQPATTEPESTTPAETTGPESESETRAEQTSGPDQEQTTSDIRSTMQDIGNGNGKGNTDSRSFKLSKKAERILILAVVLAVAAALVIFISAIRNKKMAIIRDRMYNGTDESLYPKSVMDIYGEYMNIVRHFGLKCPSVMPQTEFARVIAKECPFVAKAEADGMAALYDKVMYSDEKITLQDRDAAAAIITSVRKRMKGNMGILRRFFNRHL